MPTTLASATNVALTPIGSGNFLSPIPSLIVIIGFIPSLYQFLVNLCSISHFFPGLTPVKVALTSWFEVGSNSATLLDPASEAAAFFIRFDQPKTNDLDPLDFWGAGTPYVDFHGFWVLGECITHLQTFYNSHRDLMQRFLFG